MYLHPFDLHVPAKPLTPQYSPMGAAKPDVTRISLGYSEAEGELVHIKRKDGTVTMYMTVPCKLLMHDCSYCECDDHHTVYFTQDQIDKLEGIFRGA